MRILNFLCAAMFAFVATYASAAEQFVFFGEQPNTLCLSDKQGDIQVDDKDFKGVLIAVDNLKKENFGDGDEGDNFHISDILVNDYEFGVNPKGDRQRGLTLKR